MPRDGFPFAVFIGCEPYLLGCLGFALQFGYQLLLVCRNHVLRSIIVLNIYAEFLCLQIADVTVARQHLKVFPEELLDGFCLGRRLHYHKIFLHTFSLFLKNRLQTYANNQHHRTTATDKKGTYAGISSDIVPSVFFHFNYYFNKLQGQRLSFSISLK